MKTSLPHWFVLTGTVTLAVLAAQPARMSPSDDVRQLPTQPDVVLDWSAAISRHFEEFSLGTTPHIQVRAYAMAHLAMRDAVAAALREPRDGPDDAIGRHAASTAAYDVLVALRPAGAEQFASLHARHLAAMANASADSRGRQIGQRVAASVLHSRADDGWPVALSASTGVLAGTDSRLNAVSKPRPFLLKRVQQFEPEPPYYAYSDGVVFPNGRLRSKKLIGTPADMTSDARSIELWHAEPVMRWNQAAHSIGIQHPQDLPTRARVFAALNVALADALLAATFWSETFRHGRMEVPIAMVSGIDPFDHAAEAVEVPLHPAGPWWVAMPLNGFPSIPATLAGSADSILLGFFGRDARFALPTPAINGATLTNLRIAARQCAWAALIEGASTPEGCVAGYELGGRIATHVLKQNRR